MGVVDRWREKRKERRAKELRLRKEYLEAKAARQAADRVIKRHQFRPSSAAIAYAQTWVGTKESPPGSNAGPQITKWCRAVNMAAGPWCGAFVYACLDAAGVDDLSWRMRYCPYIVEDAKAGVNGLAKVVPLNQAQPGDLVIFQWDSGPVDHVGMFLGRDKAGGVLTVEGNTSAGSAGSQSDGGMVANRTRNAKDIAYVVRPRYPAP